MKYFFLIFFLSFFNILQASSSDNVIDCILSNTSLSKNDKFNLSNCISLTRVENGKKINDIVIENAWLENQNKIIHLDYSSMEDWIRIEFINKSNIKNINLIIDSNSTGLFTLINEEMDIVEFGDYSRNRKFLTTTVKLKLTNGINTFYLKRKGKIRLDGEIYLAKDDYLLNKEKKINLLIVFFLGATISLILFNFFFYFISREKPQLLYSIFSILVTSTMLSFNGWFSFIGLRFFHQSMEENLSLFSVGMSIFALIFGRYFLNFNKYWNNKEKKIYNFFIIFQLILLIHDVIISDFISFEIGKLIEITILFEILFLVYFSLKIRQHNKLAIFYLISWSFYFLIAFIHFLYSIDIGSYFVVQYGFFIACILELLMFSISLSYKYKLIMEDRTKAKLEAREKNRYQTQVKILSHDIANPLTVLNIAYETLQKRPDNKKLWTRMGTSIESIGRILEEARATEKENSSGNQITEAKEAFEKLKYKFEERLSEKNIELEFKGNEKLKIPVKLRTLTDSLLGNLLTNAIKFSKENQTIIMETKDLGDEVVISIKDRGAGIPEKVLLKLKKGETVTTDGVNGEKGTGFGTQIVNNIMKELEGQVDIESKHGVRNSGTKISLTFPKLSI